jgi:hypothetical protein
MCAVRCALCAVAVRFGCGSKLQIGVTYADATWCHEVNTCLWHTHMPLGRQASFSVSTWLTLQTDTVMLELIRGFWFGTQLELALLGRNCWDEDLNNMYISDYGHVPRCLQITVKLHRRPQRCKALRVRRN